jgi:hypothetical protein
MFIIHTYHSRIISEGVAYISSHILTKWLSYEKYCKHVVSPIAVWAQSISGVRCEWYLLLCSIFFLDGFYACSRWWLRTSVAGAFGEAKIEGSQSRGQADQALPPVTPRRSSLAVRRATWGRRRTSAQMRLVVEKGKQPALSGTYRVSRYSHPCFTSVVSSQKSVAKIWCCVSVRVYDRDCVIRIEEDVVQLCSL